MEINDLILPIFFILRFIVIKWKIIFIVNDFESKFYWPTFDYIFVLFPIEEPGPTSFVSISERDNPTYTRNFANVSTNRASIIKLHCRRLILNRVRCLFSIWKSFAEHLNIESRFENKIFEKFVFDSNFHRWFWT